MHNSGKKNPLFSYYLYYVYYLSSYNHRNNYLILSLLFFTIYLGLGRHNFDLLHHDGVGGDHEHDWVVGRLGHAVQQAGVTTDLGPLHQRLAVVTALTTAIRAANTNQTGG